MGAGARSLPPQADDTMRRLPIVMTSCRYDAMIRLAYFDVVDVVDFRHGTPTKVTKA